MRVNKVQKNIKFNALQIRNNGTTYYRACDISSCKDKLADTKFVDVVIDYYGLAIKDKKTDVLQRIQSFSLFPKENSVSVNMFNEKEAKYKFFFKNLDEAKRNWEDLCDKTNYNGLNYYTIIALWIDKHLDSKK